MKTFQVIFLFVGLTIVSIQAMEKKEMQDMFRDMSQDCKEKEKASDADVETMIQENYPETKEGKCLVACMQEQFGVVRILTSNFN
jgi:metal-dependent amidase/aminoacylase/carboxypeptidase family protein